jgi:hypothetical protein
MKNAIQYVEREMKRKLKLRGIPEPEKKAKDVVQWAVIHVLLKTANLHPYFDSSL